MKRVIDNGYDWISREGDEYFFESKDGHRFRVPLNSDGFFESKIFSLEKVKLINEAIEKLR